MRTLKHSLSILVDEWHVENVNEVFEKTDYGVKLIIPPLSIQAQCFTIKGHQLLLLQHACTIQTFGKPIILFHLQQNQPSFKCMFNSG